MWRTALEHHLAGEIIGPLCHSQGARPLILWRVGGWPRGSSRPSGLCSDVMSGPSPEVRGRAPSSLCELDYSAVSSGTVPPVAVRKPKTLMEWNALLAMGSFLTPEQLAAKKKLSMLDQGRIMVKAFPRGARVAEFIAMWTIVKYKRGSASAEDIADVFGEPVRTVYRRLHEFREVWGPAGFDTPDKLADGFIADFKRRQESLNESMLARLISADVNIPVKAPASPVG